MAHPGWWTLRFLHCIYFLVLYPFLNLNMSNVFNALRRASIGNVRVVPMVEIVVIAIEIVTIDSDLAVANLQQATSHLEMVVGISPLIVTGVVEVVQQVLINVTVKRIVTTNATTRREERGIK